MPVIIKEYSPKLAKLFEQERSRLSKLMSTNITFEHVGSSAVYIGGKNIVDILIGVPERKDLIFIKNILIRNGYVEGDDSHEDRIFLANTNKETTEGDFHIHICPIYEESYRDFIRLRNFLRENPDKAQEYFQKKLEFSEKANYNRKKYKALKSAYVSELLNEAKKSTDSRYTKSIEKLNTSTEDQHESGIRVRTYVFS